MAKLPKVVIYQPNMGCDPEFFFKTDGEVIGAEKVIPKKGIDVVRYTGQINTSKFIIDGVQAELNPTPSTCREGLAEEIRACFLQLQSTLQAKKDAKVELDFSKSIEISEKNLAELDKENQKLGCMPSKSVYANTTSMKLTDVDPLKHRQRSAGGHIHIGHSHYKPLIAVFKDRPDDVVKMLDIICGNTCVLFDRDEGNRIRRKLYGRAGEYRLPSHGLEYRTLSNFWLEAYPMMSLAFGLARLACQLMTDEKNSAAYFKAFTEAVDQDDITKAINENDFDLAYANFKKIEPLLMEVCYSESGHHPINSSNIATFHYFVNKVKTSGLKHFFKQDPMTHWTNLNDINNNGFYNYMRLQVTPMMEEEQKKKTA